MEDENKFSCVGLVFMKGLSHAFLELASRLQREYGSRIVLYARTKEDLAYFRSLDREGLASHGAVCDILGQSVIAGGLDERAVIERAARLEQELGLTIGRLALSHRHLGKGFSVGGFNMPTPRRFRAASHLQYLHAYSNQVEFWQNEIRQQGLTLLLQADNVAAAVCAAEGIAFRFVIGSRYLSYWFWAKDEKQTNPLLERAYAQAQPDPNLLLEQAYVAARFKRTSFGNRVSIINAVRHAMLSVPRHVWGRWRGYDRAIDFSLLDGMSRPWRERLGYNKVQKYCNAPLDSVRGAPFLYFPLHKEPEASFHNRSPECFNQHAVIQSLARDLPANVRLVVKENYNSYNRRPLDFFDQVSALKNVILLDPDEDGLDCVRSATAVATITGTAGLEAAVMGKPVIAFGRHQPICRLPHVTTITDSAQLAPVLRRTFSEPWDRETALRDGSRLLAAIVAASFDLGNFTLGNADLDAARLDRMHKGLLASVLEEVVQR